MVTKYHFGISWLVWVMLQGSWVVKIVDRIQWMGGRGWCVFSMSPHINFKITLGHTDHHPHEWHDNNDNAMHIQFYAPLHNLHFVFGVSQKCIAFAILSSRVIWMQTTTMFSLLRSPYSLSPTNWPADRQRLNDAYQMRFSITYFSLAII